MYLHFQQSMARPILIGLLLFFSLAVKAKPFITFVPYDEDASPAFEYPSENVTIHLRKGEKYLLVGKYDSALYHLFDGVKILEKGNAGFLLGKTYYGLGMIYYKLKDPARALEYYEKAEELISQTRSCIDLGNLYIDIGLALIDEEKIDMAFDFYDKAVSVCKPMCSNAFLMRLRSAEGAASLKNGDFSKALSRLDSALEIARALGDRRSISEIIVRLSAAHYETGDYQMAGNLLDEVESLACGLELNDVLLEVYRQRILVMSKAGNVRSQAEYQAKFIELSESLYNEQIMAKLAELEVDFKERENIKAIEQQRHSLALSRETMAKKTRLIWLGVVCVVLGVIVAIMLVRAVRRKKRTINSLVGEVEDATAMLEDRMRQEHNAEASKDMELRSALQKMKADVASLLGICMVASRCAADEQTKARFGQVQHDLSELKRRLEGL